MRKKILLIIVAGLFMFPVFAQHPPLDKNWDTVFVDDFSTFNIGRWHKAHNAIHGNYEYNNPQKQTEEPQVYIQDNAYIENGKLVLRTKQQTYPCPKGHGYLNCQYGGTHNYTSGQIASNATYKYGYFEIYAKLPASSGYWPAFWLWNSTSSTQTSNCWYNEIDIFESSGCNNNIVTSNMHYGFQCPTNIYSNSKSVSLEALNYNNKYHWYGLEWDKNKITWYIDRKIVRQIANNMEGTGIQNPMYIILNVALNPIVSWWDCQISNSTIFPNYMYVDTANVWRLKYDCNTPVTINNANDLVNHDYKVKKSISLSGATTLISGQNVSLRATDYIELKEGFYVPPGAELYLDNNPCENIGIIKKERE